MVNISQAVFEGTAVILLGEKKKEKDKSHIKGSYVIRYIANGASKEILHLVTGIFKILEKLSNV